MILMMTLTLVCAAGAINAVSHGSLGGLVGGGFAVLKALELATH